MDIRRITEFSINFLEGHSDQLTCSNCPVLRVPSKLNWSSASTDHLNFWEEYDLNTAIDILQYFKQNYANISNYADWS
jgi:hypothetical protein